MPTYDYICRKCGHEFELFQSMTDPVKRTCPECGRKALERLVGAGAGVLFKGTGFYQTDYRSDSYKKAAEAEKKPAENKSAENSAAKRDASIKSEPMRDAKATVKKPRKPKASE